MEPGLDPANSLVKDEAAMNVLRLESRIASVVSCSTEGCDVADRHITLAWDDTSERHRVPDGST